MFKTNYKKAEYEFLKGISVITFTDVRRITIIMEQRMHEHMKVDREVQV